MRTNLKGLTTFDSAALALDAYNDHCAGSVPNAPSWKPFNNEGLRLGSTAAISGFFGRAYFNANNKTVIVAFRGSENPLKNASAINDWATNLQQWGLGSPSEQYRLALELTQNVQKLCNKKGYKLLGCTGHSLGGGLAALVALQMKLYAVTFNPAPIRQPTEKLREDVIASHVLNYVSGKDFVSRLNPFVGFAIESAKTATNSYQGAAVSVLLNIKRLGETLGEALAALTVETHTLIPGITLNINNDSGHSMDDLVAHMASNKSAYEGIPWPLRR